MIVKFLPLVCMCLFSKETKITFACWIDQRIKMANDDNDDDDVFCTEKNTFVCPNFFPKRIHMQSLNIVLHRK